MAIAARGAGCQEEEISQKAAVLATAAYVVRIFLQDDGEDQAGGCENCCGSSPNAGIDEDQDDHSPEDRSSQDLAGALTAAVEVDAIAR